jgi:hypothetical protein
MGHCVTGGGVEQGIYAQVDEGVRAPPVPGIYDLTRLLSNLFQQ